MDLFRFLKRPIRTTVPQPVPQAQIADEARTPPRTEKPDAAPTAGEVRRLLFDAVASGDESRLDALCKEHGDFIVQNHAAWLEVPHEFRISPALQEWYRQGLHAISQHCAEKAASLELSDSIREVLDGPAGHRE